MSSSTTNEAGPVKIACLQVENVKRVQAVQIVCAPDGLTIIGGRNGQGKTSVLDSIMWTLGGEKFRPSDPGHNGQEPATHVELSNGITVERKGKNSSLKVSGPEGKGGQKLLDEFVNTFALNLPRFLTANGTEKAAMLLKVFPGLGEQLEKLNADHKRLFDQRHALGQIAERKKKHAEDLPFDSTAPAEPLTGSDMTKRLQAAMAVNAQNDAKRRNVNSLRENVHRAQQDAERQRAMVAQLEKQLVEAREKLDMRQRQAEAVQRDLVNATAETASLVDQDTTAIERELAAIDEVNAIVRRNQQKEQAEAEASELAEQYESMTQELEAVRAARLKLLASVEMPLDGLSIDEGGELIYQGRRWDCMSGSQQLQVGTAICAAVQPACGFVLLDKLESMDLDSLDEFGAWLRQRGLQAIGTRVSTGDECSILIEDGVVSTPEQIKARKKEEYQF